MTYIMQPYDDALGKILKDGIRKNNRTGVDTIAINGMQCRYDISTHYPLLTKRKVWPESVLAELLWFLSGSTNNNDLLKLGAKFWTPWVSRDFENTHGLEEGDLGAVYGFQLRHFGADYKEVRKLEKQIDELHIEYQKQFGKEEDLRLYHQWDHQCVFASTTIANQLDYLKNRLKQKSGFDQLKYLEHELKTNPSSRRIMFSLWNMCDYSIMRLCPCHFSFQLLLDGKDRLTGILTQRSCDFPIGIPANIQFYATLILMLAHVGGFEPYELVHNTNDSHIYVDQIEAVEEYLSRPEVDSPKIKIDHKGSLFDKDGTILYRMGDFSITGYNPLPVIKIPVAV